MVEMTKVEVCTHIAYRKLLLSSLHISSILTSSLFPQITVTAPIRLQSHTMVSFPSSISFSHQTPLTSLSSSTLTTTSNPTLTLDFLILRYRTALNPRPPHHRLRRSPRISRSVAQTHSPTIPASKKKGPNTDPTNQHREIAP